MSMNPKMKEKSHELHYLIVTWRQFTVTAEHVQIWVKSPSVQTIDCIKIWLCDHTVIGSDRRFWRVIGGKKKHTRHVGMSETLTEKSHKRVADVVCYSKWHLQFSRYSRPPTHCGGVCHMFTRPLAECCHFQQIENNVSNEGNRKRVFPWLLCCRSVWADGTSLFPPAGSSRLAAWRNPAWLRGGRSTVAVTKICFTSKN